MRWIGWVTLSWIFTAAVVSRMAHTPLAHVLVVAFAALVASQLIVPHGSVDRAIALGLAWLTLSIAAEVAMSLSVGHGWFALFGAPSEGWRRDVVAGAWVGAPALFTRILK
jgi:hypothetical protein